jgi:hypothetical protein
MTAEWARSTIVAAGPGVKRNGTPRETVTWGRDSAPGPQGAYWGNRDCVENADMNNRGDPPKGNGRSLR